MNMFRSRFLLVLSLWAGVVECLLTIITREPSGGLKPSRTLSTLSPCSDDASPERPESDELDEVREENWEDDMERMSFWGNFDSGNSEGRSGPNSNGVQKHNCGCVQKHNCGYGLWVCCQQELRMLLLIHVAWGRPNVSVSIMCMFFNSILSFSAKPSTHSTGPATEGRKLRVFHSVERNHASGESGQTAGK